MTGRLPAVILGGGRAMRMGGADKILLDLGGRPLVTHLLDRLASQAGQIAINANGDPQRFAAFGLPVLGDSLPDQPGPLAGILAGMDWAASLGARAVLTAAGDTPFPPDDLAARLIAAAGPAGLALAANVDPQGSLRLHPTFGLWPVGLRDDLRAALRGGMRRPRVWAEAHGSGIAIFGGSDDGFFNINTPADLRRAQAMV